MNVLVDIKVNYTNYPDYLNGSKQISINTNRVETHLNKVHPAPLFYKKASMILFLPLYYGAFLFLYLLLFALYTSHLLQIFFLPICIGLITLLQIKKLLISKKPFYIDYFPIIISYEIIILYSRPAAVDRKQLSCSVG